MDRGSCHLQEAVINTILKEKKCKKAGWLFEEALQIAEDEIPILWPPDVKNWLTGKDTDAMKDCGQEEKGTTEDEMVGWHHQLDGHEFEQALGVGEGQGRTRLSDWTELNHLPSPQRKHTVTNINVHEITVSTGTE